MYVLQNISLSVAEFSLTTRPSAVAGADESPDRIQNRSRGPRSAPSLADTFHREYRALQKRLSTAGEFLYDNHVATDENRYHAPAQYECREGRRLEIRCLLEWVLVVYYSLHFSLIPLLIFIY